MTTQIQNLQWRIGQINEASGFNQLQDVPADFQQYYIGSKLMLMVTELAEAFEEIRSGHAPTETYYPTAPKPGMVTDAAVHYYKPEGLPSELADTVIRALSLSYELGIDLDAIIVEKLNYNATRSYRHGKQF